LSSSFLFCSCLFLVLFLILLASFCYFRSWFATAIASCLLLLFLFFICHCYWFISYACLVVLLYSCHGVKYMLQPYISERRCIYSYAVIWF
jgi:hypothetical protein